MKLEDLPDKELMARIIWGEARNQGHLGKQAVGNVIMNRLNDPKKRFGKTMHEVMLKPFAFSCLNKNDSNLKLILAGPKDKAMTYCDHTHEELCPKVRIAVDGTVKIDRGISIDTELWWWNRLTGVRQNSKIKD